MEFGGREIMILVGILVLVAIVLDVVRRIRRARYEKIRMPRRRQPIFDDDVEFDEYGSELPSGGARIVGRRDDSDIQELSRSMKEIAESSKPKLSIFEQRKTAPDLDTSLAEPVPESEPQSALEAEPEPATAETAPESQSEAAEASESEEAIDGVVVLHVMAEKGKTFSGLQLLQALQENGMHYGDMDIFHCHNSADEVLFSLANSVNPGTFELESMSQFKTPGVIMFFDMERVSDPLQAFESLLVTAHELVQRLGGQLCDERRHRMSTATLTVLRERVENFASRRNGAR